MKTRTIAETACWGRMKNANQATGISVGMRMIWPWLVWLAVAVLVCRPGFACTAFFIDHGGHRIMGANMDWPSGEGMVVINKRGFSKTAVTDPAKALNPVGWTSRYGSVTFNLYGVDWPWAGINEAGLAAGGLILRQAEYPVLDDRPSIFFLQWLQYQLDNFGSVREVLDHLPKIRIRPVIGGNGVHHFFCDRTGDAAVIEFLDGQARVYHGDNLPVRVMANDPYGPSLAYLKKFDGFGGDYPISTSNLPQDRFVRAADGLVRFASADSDAAVAYAFGLLETTAVRSHREYATQWQIAFDLIGRRIYYHTRDNPRRRKIDMAGFDFSCRDRVRMRDIHLPETGDGSGFKEYRAEENRLRVERFFRRHPLKPMEYEARVDRVSRYPDTFVCATPYGH